jgi:hypothetical protein
MARKERPIAVIAPSVRSIKLYADGRIEYQGKVGSVIGASARIDRSGQRTTFRDTRKVVLRIEGPSVAIAAAMPPAAFKLHRYAEEFVTQVNQMSNGVDGAASAPAAPSAPDPATTTSPDHSTPVETPAPSGGHEVDLPSMDVLIGQLERLGKLRDSGILTEDEFQEQKAALLRAARNS